LLSTSTRLRRIIAGALGGATALAVMPILGFTGVAGAADALPPVAQPVGEGNVCAYVSGGNDFTDVDPASAEVINCLLYAAITTGTSDTSFSPNNTVTRRQMALFVKRQIDLANARERTDLQDLPTYDGAPGYPDVADEDEQFKQAIGQLAQAEIVGGFADGNYRPSAPISRRQMAAFVNRTQEFLSGAPFAGDGNYFDDDDDEAQSVQQDFNGLAAAGIFQGDGKGNVSPAGALTRRQMANILLRHLQVNFQQGAIAQLFEPSSNQDFTVTSQDVELLTVSDAAAPARGQRAYSVAIPDGQSISIGLIEFDRMGMDQHGIVSFFDDDRNGSADGLCQTAARIEVVDGDTISADDGDDCVTATSSGGEITFTVNTETPDQLVRPVVWAPATPGGDLTVDDTVCTTFTDTEPALRYCQSEVPVGVGGLSLYAPEEAAPGFYDNQDVVTRYSMDGQASLTAVGQADGANSYFEVDADDTFAFDTADCGGASGARALSYEEFGALLSWTSLDTNVAGDVLSTTPDVVTVQYDPAGTSTFTIVCDRPERTWNLVADLVGSDVELEWPGLLNFDVTGYDVYRAEADGSFAKIGTVGSGGTVTFTDAGVAPGTYRYLVVAVSAYSTSENSVVVEVTVPNA
jgi:hypothetical protein